MTHPLKNLKTLTTRNAHFSKTLATVALLTGLLVACGEGAPMPDEMNPDEGGASGTDTITGGTGGTHTNTATGGTGTSTGGTVATGGVSATGGTTTGGTPGTGGVNSTGGAPATGGAGGTVQEERPKPKAELTPNDFIPRFFYALIKFDTDQKLKIAQAPEGAWPGCKGLVHDIVFSDEKQEWLSLTPQGTFIRSAKVDDFGKYPNAAYEKTGLFNTDLIMGYNPKWTPKQEFLEMEYANAKYNDTLFSKANPPPTNWGNCPGFPRE